MLVPGPVQTTYTQYINVGQNGMPATMTGWDVDTRVFEEEASPAAGVGFGLAVCQGSNDNGCRLGIMSGRHFVGVTRSDSTLPNIASGFTDVYQGGENVNVHVRGDIWVIVHTATVAASGAVYCNSSNGQLGDSTISNAVQITNARWETSATSGNLAVLRLGALPGL